MSTAPAAGGREPWPYVIAAGFLIVILVNIGFTVIAVQTATALDPSYDATER